MVNNDKLRMVFFNEDEIRFSKEKSLSVFRKQLIDASILNRPVFLLQRMLGKDTHFLFAKELFNGFVDELSNRMFEDNFKNYRRRKLFDNDKYSYSICECIQGLINMFYDGKPEILSMQQYRKTFGIFCDFLINESRFIKEKPKNKFQREEENPDLFVEPDNYIDNDETIGNEKYFYEGDLESDLVLNNLSKWENIINDFPYPEEIKKDIFTGKTPDIVRHVNE